MTNKRCKNCSCFIGKNKHRCDDIRKKQSESHKEKRLSEEHKKNISIGNKGNKKTKEDKEECRQRMINRIKEGKLKIVKGEEHWNWQGGISTFNRKLRNHSKWKIWREAIFLRDNFTCQNNSCSYCSNKIGVFLHPHHIKPLALYPELVFHINNGITYCAKFHLNSKELHKGIIHNRNRESRRNK